MRLLSQLAPLPGELTRIASEMFEFVRLRKPAHLVLNFQLEKVGFRDCVSNEETLHFRRNFNIN